MSSGEDTVGILSPPNLYGRLELSLTTAPPLDHAGGLNNKPAILRTLNNNCGIVFIKPKTASALDSLTIGKYEMVFPPL